jgi:hypothetical protein
MVDMAIRNILAAEMLGVETLVIKTLVTVMGQPKLAEAMEWTALSMMPILSL